MQPTSLSPPHRDLLRRLPPLSRPALPRYEPLRRAVPGHGFPVRRSCPPHTRYRSERQTRPCSYRTIRHAATRRARPLLAVHRHGDYPSRPRSARSDVPPRPGPRQRRPMRQHLPLRTGSGRQATTRQCPALRLMVTRQPVPAPLQATNHDSPFPAVPQRQATAFQPNTSRFDPLRQPFPSPAGATRGDEPAPDGTRPSDVPTHFFLYRRDYPPRPEPCPSDLLRLPCALPGDKSSRTASVQGDMPVQRQRQAKTLATSRVLPNRVAPTSRGAADRLIGGPASST